MPDKTNNVMRMGHLTNLKATFPTLTALLLTLLFALRVAALEPPQWNVEALSQPPAAVAAQEGKVEGLQSLYLDGLPYKGRPTKFYAYLGLPANVTGGVPAVVLIHGGGGTAFDKWVRYWNGKGYAALSLDTEGHVPVNVRAGKSGDAVWQTIDSLGRPWAGQPQRPSGFADSKLPPEEQWLYHGVADAILSVSFLAARPEVDASRIGIVGISMGSVVCSIAGGLDHRLAFVVPQYIGGNNDLGNVWYAIIKEHPEVMRWDPANFYRQPRGKAHWLWINDANDKYGLPPMTAKSWRETGPDSWMTLLPVHRHGHRWEETGPNAVREIYAFADSVTRGTPPLARILSTSVSKGGVNLTWSAQTPIVRAQFIHTTEPIPLMKISGDSRKDWEHVKWQVQDIPLPTATTLSDGTRQATFALTAGLKAGYLNLIDDRSLAVSSDFLNLDP